MNEAKYLHFVFTRYSESGKTKVWTVGNKDELEDLLGEIRWFSPWRCYAFYPFSDTIFEKTCLRDIADFCENQTNLQKKEKK